VKRTNQGAASEKHFVQASRSQAQIDTELVERARDGDTEAFGELIQTHREQAMRWAERMTRDSHMADDVVQDALIRAFLHLGSLADTSRFLPWLHRIVQNQANMRLRRGGPYKHEKPITLMGSSRDSTRLGRVDWDDLDSILSHLTKSASDAAAHQNDPAEHLLRKELYETIHALLHCLNKREKSIFEAYFFRQLTPDEIAELYKTSTGTVYTYLHRSRQKLRQEHVRVYLGLHKEQERGGWKLCKHKVIPLPLWPDVQKVKTTFVDRIGHLLTTLNDPRPIEDLMGISGFAFRMKISNKTTFSDGIYVYDWRQTVRDVMDNLGYEATILCGQLSNAPVPLLAASERFPVVLPIEEAVLPFIRRFIDSGKPLLYFDTWAKKPYVHEWSLLYGYDDEKRVVYVTDAMCPDGKSIPYHEVANNPLRFLVGITPYQESQSTRNGSAIEQAVESIQFAVHYARKGCTYHPLTVYLNYTSGLSAYDRWISYLRNRFVTPNRYGMGQLAAVYGEARRKASQYLRNIPLNGEAMRLILLASEAYEQAADALDAVSELVPFIKSAEMLQEETLESCTKFLEQARDFEAAGVSYMEKTLTLLERGTYI
jgi:RNA polymerase sigma factor (sigma-70 family)